MYFSFPLLIIQKQQLHQKLCQVHSEQELVCVLKLQRVHTSGQTLPFYLVSLYFAIQLDVFSCFQIRDHGRKTLCSFPALHDSLRKTFFSRRRLNVLLAVTGFYHKNIFVGLQLIEVFKSIHAVIEHLMIGHGNQASGCKKLN